MKHCRRFFAICSSLILLSSLLLLSGCNLFVDPKVKPKDTDIAYWVTDELTQDEVDKMNMVTLNFDILYLDPSYQADKDEEGNNILPESYVAYRIGDDNKNPDAKNVVIRILINDPDVYVYGITISSSDQEISKNLRRYGFQLNGVGTFGIGEYWSKENVFLRVSPYSKVGIQIDYTA